MTQSLKKLLGRNEIVVAPGCHDALGAKIVEKMGFEAVYMTGNGATASQIGKPDVGLLTMTEMVTTAQKMSSAVNIPIIADADTGYGNKNNVARTIIEYEKAGVSAIHLEDQVTPKKCGAMSGIELISIEEHVEKIQAALNARKSEDLLIIGRTDSRGTLGLEEAIKRGNAYAKAGADLVILEMLQSIEEIKEVARRVDAPLMFSYVDFTRIPNITFKQLEEFGYKLVIYPLSSTLAYAKTMQDLLKSLKTDETTKGFEEKMISLHEYEDLLELEKYK
jgi:2,3-dimethylmalate lyase